MGKAIKPKDLIFAAFTGQNRQQERADSDETLERDPDQCVEMLEDPDSDLGDMAEESGKSDARKGSVRHEGDEDSEKKTEELLRRLERNEPNAQNELFEHVYDLLRQRAKWLTAGVLITKKPTDLVHDVYLKLMKQDLGKNQFENQKKFLSYTTKAMRNIIIDYIKTKRKNEHISIKNVEKDIDIESKDEKSIQAFVDYNNAMKKLESLNPKDCVILDLYYMEGLTGKEIAKQLGMNATTAQCKLTELKKWLKAELGHLDK